MDEVDPLLNPRLAEALLICAGAGVVMAALTAMTGSASALATHLLDHTHHSSQLKTLQLRSLSASLADMTAARQAIATAARVETTDARHPFGAPVVT